MQVFCLWEGTRTQGEHVPPDSEMLCGQNHHALPFSEAQSLGPQKGHEKFQAAKCLSKINREVKLAKMNGIKTLSPQEVVCLNMKGLMLCDGINLYLHPSVSLKTNFYFPFEGKTFGEHEVPSGL